MRRRRAPALAALVLAALAAAGGARADTDSCRVEVAIEPATAFVGEQVVYRLRLLRRESVTGVRWLRALSFPSLRAEWLPGRTPDPAIEGIGEGYLVSEERRALFAVRAGAIEVPAARLGCQLADGSEQEVEVPGATLTAVALPVADAPADFAGVVGPVQVRLHASARKVELGRSVTLAAVVAGPANVWAAAPPIDPAALAGVDVYPRPPELQLEPGERLGARRTFVWELVPRRAGRIDVPRPRVRWFDPATRTFALAEAASLSIVVGDVVGDVPANRAPGDAPAAAPGGGGAPGVGGWRRALALALGAALVAALAATALVRARRRRAPLQTAVPALEEAAQALAAGDRERAAGALAAALRAGLAARVPGASALTAEEIGARSGGSAAIAEAAVLLGALDRARFALPGAAGNLPGAERVRDVLRALAAESSAKS